MFLAILIIMGLNHLPKVCLYWSSNEMFGNRRIQGITKRDRFDTLLNNFHLLNNEDLTADNDRLLKLKGIVNLICNQFKETLSPGNSVVIDESMVPWRDQLVFRQYLPAKSHKYGLKLYKICTPEGYTYDLRIYAGKNAPDVQDNKHGHTFNICMDLLEGLL
ncbi:hypothetical protein NQ314_015624 [Rhamnusium bicolor]|uniref:PiggyBac transposable element-derived protein domain-containing protein n=1 Tax=Rhamnusium bicolor TaxID=1586634 RepID=A0AAV8WY98_9CUCU|nr:hypothetical protein NQ314_015624 [Rhamnusium bicolor]